MPKIKSPTYIEKTQALAADEVPLVLLEVAHALMAEPMRFVNDVQDVVSNGHNYVASSFNLVWPDDQERQTPRAKLSISNRRAEVGAFFERTHGGMGAVVTALQIMRSNPDFIEERLVLDVSNIEANTSAVVGTLGYDDILNLPGTPYTYRPESAPGLF